MQPASSREVPDAAVQWVTSGCAVCGKAATAFINIRANGPSMSMAPAEMEPRCAEHNPYHFTAVVYKADQQRLKEAIWRIQGLVTKGRLANYRRRQIDSELELLAEALGVKLL